MMAIDDEDMVVCDLNDETDHSEVEVYSPKLETRWQNLWTEGKRIPGVVPDCNPLENPPAWFDLERFTKAQKLAKKYYFR